MTDAATRVFFALDDDSVAAPSVSNLVALSLAGGGGAPAAWLAERPDDAPSAPPGRRQGVYRQLGESLGAGRPGSPWLLAVGVEVDAEVEEEFNEWYDREHLPLLSVVDGVLRARRFVLETAESEAPTPYLALFDLRDGAVPDSAQWHECVSTPWCARIFRHRRLLFRSVYLRS